MCKRIYMNQKGTTAIEFSLLALPFCLFVIGIIELALMFASGFLLQGAVSDAARLIRTGQVQQAGGGDPADMFREALCGHAVALISCDDIQFNVQTLDSFAAQGSDMVFDEDGNLTSQDFDAGGVRDVVLIQVAYLYPLMTPMIGEFFSDYPGNKRLLTSVVVFETEPYQFTDS